MPDDQFVEKLVDGLSADEAAVVRDIAKKRLASVLQAGQVKAIDPALDSDHSFAFRWVDLVALSDLLEVFRASAGTSDIKMGLLRRLLSVWSRLRSIRVELNKDQALVVLAVKRWQKQGNASLEKIQAETGLPMNDLKIMVGKLCGMMYLENTPILRESKGLYTTDF